MDQEHIERIRFDLLRRIAEDAGRVKGLAEYQAEFPGHEDLIASVFRRLFTERPVGSAGQPSNRDEGKVLPVEAYQAPFPKHADLIGAAHAALQAGTEGSRSAPTLEEIREEPTPPDLNDLTMGNGSRLAQALPPSIGGYPVISRLKGGGMGDLFLASHRAIPSKRVVLKTVKRSAADFPRAISRLKQEAEALGRLDHEGICSVLDVVTQDGDLFVVMPFIEGDTLASRIDRARRLRGEGASPQVAWSAIVSAEDVGSDGQNRGTVGDPTSSGRTKRSRVVLSEVLRLIEEIARAVHAAHEKSVIHRDLKPGNIMVRSNGKPVVLDFGLAMDLSQDSEAQITLEGEVVGTPVYMAPEQAKAERAEFSERTDVYALGAILYELLTLHRAFGGATTSEVLARVASGRFRPPRALNAMVPRDLEAVCLRAMERDPSRRYPTAAEFADELARVRNLEPTIARPLSVVGRAGRFLRRRGWAIAAVGLIVILGVASLWFWLSKEALQAPIRAFSRYTKDREEGRPPAEADLRTIADVYSDRSDAEAFMRNPCDNGEYLKMQRALLSRAAERGSASESAERLLEPRGTIEDARPTFRFQVPDVGAETWALRLTLWSGDSPPIHTETIPHSGGARDLSRTLPAAVILPLGKTLTWSVQSTGEPDPDHPRYAPDAASFRVEDPAARLAVLSQIKVTGDPGFDALLRANALLRRGYAKDALTELATMPSDSSREVRRLAMLFRAEAALRLGDQATFEKLRKEALESGGRR